MVQTKNGSKWHFWLRGVFVPFFIVVCDMSVEFVWNGWVNKLWRDLDMGNFNLWRSVCNWSYPVFHEFLIQGGIDGEEDARIAAFRELKEETGVTSAEILAEVTNLYYNEHFFSFYFGME